MINPMSVVKNVRTSYKILTEKHQGSRSAVRE